MAEDTEKRFHSIMDKLFQSPKSHLPLSSRESSLSAQKSRGQKRPYSATQSNSKGDKDEGIRNAAQPPPCRPWDRGDLMRRVATFKSMKWFAKPKVMDALNCARRGWVNVDMDIIACEYCGARLQFSTPSTWRQQQVEKAALVFSLKLDSGHKLLCPWGDNACDENLGLFPPLPAPVLVGHYRERSASLLQLSALPVISSSAIESMKSPQLEHLLEQSIAVECGAEDNGSSSTEHLENDMKEVSADSYYQAHRLLSLCGWEPRSLPYVVDCSDQSNNSTSSTDVSEKNNRLCVYVSDSGETRKENEEHVAPGLQFDPSSTVLDCKLCGASIGLWAFKTVPRPLELIRVIGYTETGGGTDNQSANGEKELSTLNKEVMLSKEAISNFSIAGGPPATKQNFRAKVSLPVVGRNMRTRFSWQSSELRNSSQQTGSDGAQDLPSSADTGEFNQATVDSDCSIVGGSGTGSQNNIETLVGNSIGGAPSSTTVDDGSNLQKIPPDNTAIPEDISSIPSAGSKEIGMGEAAKTALQKDISMTSTDVDLQRHSSDKKMDFHPVRQHRHFCPWVASKGTTASGWQQTLSALQKEKVFSLPESDSPSSPSLIKLQVDDPITSIRKLFESPPTKRAKPTQFSQSSIAN